MEKREQPEPQELPQEQKSAPKRISRKKKILRAVLWSFGILFGLILIVAVTRNLIVEMLVEQIGSRVLGVPVEMGMFMSNPQGQVAISELTIGNPEGYQYPNAFELKHLSLKVDPWSLFRDRIVIEHIEIKGMRVNYEPKNDGNNISEIINNIQRYAGSPDKKESATPRESVEQETAGKALFIRRIDFAENALSVSIPALKSTFDLPMLELHFTDIGKDSHSIADTMNEVFTKIMQSAVEAAKSTGQAFYRLSKTSLQKAGEMLKTSGQESSRESGKFFKKVKNWFK